MTGWRTLFGQVSVTYALTEGIRLGSTGSPEPSRIPALAPSPDRLMPVKGLPQLLSRRTHGSPSPSETPAPQVPAQARLDLRGQVVRIDNQAVHLPACVHQVEVRTVKRMAGIYEGNVVFRRHSGGWQRVEDREVVPVAQAPALRSEEPPQLESKQRFSAD